MEFSSGKPLPPPPSSVKPRNESLGSTLPTYRNRPSTHGTPSSGLSGISFANTRSMFEKLKDSKELKTGLSNMAKNPMVQKAAMAVAKDERVQSAAISAIRNPSVQAAAINATLSNHQSGGAPQPLSIREKNIASLAKQFESKPIMGLGLPPPVGHRSTQPKHDNAFSASGSIYPSLSAMDPFDYPPQIPSTNSANSATETASSIQKFAWGNSASAKSPEPLTNEPHAIVKYSYKAAGPDELSCASDDTVLLKREVDGQWIYATNVRTGEAGIVPLSFLHVKVPLVPTSTSATSPSSPYHYDATSPAGHTNRSSTTSNFGLGLGQSLRLHDMPTAKALFDFDTGVEGDLAFRGGTLIAIVGKVNDEWLRGEVNGVQGIFPANYVQLDAPHNLTSLPSIRSSTTESNATTTTTVTAAYDFQSDVEGDLPFSAGDVIEVVKGPTEPNGGWMVGRLHGVTGLVPLTYVNHNF